MRCAFQLSLAFAPRCTAVTTVPLLSKLVSTMPLPSYAHISAPLQNRYRLSSAFANHIIAVADKGMTVFPRNENGEPVLYDYQIKGFFKDSCGMLARVGGKTETGKKRAVNESGKLSAYKKVIDGLIFPQPRMIPIKVNGKIGDCQRPLRAQTAQGERVSLANSEEIPAGSTCEFEILLMDESLENAVLEWLDYGVLRGIGQWRNSGKGRFTFDIID